VRLAQFQQGIGAAPADEAEVACSIGEANIHELIHQTVVQARNALADHGLLGSGPLRYDLVPPVAAVRQHLGNEFWRVLEVGVHDDDELARGHSEPGKHGRFLAEVARETKSAHMRVRSSELTCDPAGSVATSVVDEDEFPRVDMSVQLIADACVEQRERRLLFVAGNDDG